MEHENDGEVIYNYYVWNRHQRLKTEIGGLVNKRTSGYHLNYSIVEINQNIEKNPGDLKTLAVTENPVKINHLTLM